MQKKVFVIKNKLGLHARPAAILVQMAAKFKSQVKIIKDGQEVDGKSIMGIMTLAAAAGTDIKIAVAGEDENEAMGALSQLIESGFGEE
ncbi:MAG: HPr family phosphocarrier protein [Endomicrobiales bacterium]|nr:HPr family phosphocarrier protein [Endomicrobiales bacterium]